MNSRQDRIQRELEIYREQKEVHELPEIFHYWSNRHLRPLEEEFGFSNPDEFFVKYLLEAALTTGRETPQFISLGAGNCDTEVRVAKALRENGLRRFRFECLELNPDMIRRGQQLAEEYGIKESMVFTRGDFNCWAADRKYDGVMANQSLHHMLELERVFDEIRGSLHSNGYFVTSDMIGRNGHQRWPEALEAVHRFWKQLPREYRYNHQLRRYEDLYKNWDCSNEGFEGIRAQDILPLLLERFHFQLFIGFSNVIDVFIDRAFGHNFDGSSPADRDFIDRVHAYDEAGLRDGTLKPTHMMAVMATRPVASPAYSRGLSPEFCVRKPDKHSSGSVARTVSGAVRRWVRRKIRFVYRWIKR